MKHFKVKNCTDPQPSYCKVKIEMLNVLLVINRLNDRQRLYLYCHEGQSS